MADRILDVSEWQGEIDWEAVPASVVGGVVRVAEWRLDRGGPRLDRQARNNVLGLLGTGRAVGGYMRVNPPRRSPEDEAVLFCALLEHFGLDEPGCIVPAVDIEPTVDASSTPEEKAAEAAVNWPWWTREFIRVYQDIAADPRLRWYTSGSFFDSRYGGVVDIPLDVTLWVGHWSGAFSNPKNPNGDPALAEAWAGRTPYVFSGRTQMHQYFKAPMPGITANVVDLNCLMPGVQLGDVVL